MDGCKCGGWTRGVSRGIAIAGHRKTCRMGKVGIASGFVNLDVFHQPLRGGGHERGWLALYHGFGEYKFKHFSTVKAGKAWLEREHRAACLRRRGR